METKSDYAQDNNVLTKKDEFDGFKPMPKRFMVWDKNTHEWFANPRYSTVFSLPELFAVLGDTFYLHIEWEIVQSTNLFDKDGKEIFEGGIIDYDGNGAALGVVVSIDGQWQLKDKYGNLMFLKGAPHQKLIGHILSNPELVVEE